MSLSARMWNLTRTRACLPATGYSRIRNLRLSMITYILLTARKVLAKNTPLTPLTKLRWSPPSLTRRLLTQQIRRAISTRWAKLLITSECRGSHRATISPSTNPKTPSNPGKKTRSSQRLSLSKTRRWTSISESSVETVLFQTQRSKRTFSMIWAKMVYLCKFKD